MSVIEMFRQQSLEPPANPVYDCNFLQIDKTRTSEHNSPQVLGTSPLSLLPGTQFTFPAAFLLKHLGLL